MDLYLQLKVFVEQYSGLERDALHIHAALLLYIIAIVVFRQSRRSRIPWLVVLAVELVNELFDLRAGGVELSDINAKRADPAVVESIKDLWNTMLWPTVLLFIGRYTTLFQHRSRVKKEDPAPSADE